jgi:hypothetical protein
MKYHIVGAGPTGLTVAWNLSKVEGVEVHVYESKSGPGGSWWEPSEEYRNLHATRAIFKSGSPNLRRLFREMKLKWGDFFGNSKLENYFSQIELLDFVVLGSLYLRVSLFPGIYRRRTLHESVGGLSPKGEKFLSSITYLIDGVSWDVMTAYEFIRVFDTLGLRSHDTQIRSGAYMANRMAKAIAEQGVMFHYDTKLASVLYSSDSYEATFEDGSIISDGTLVLCVDNGPARLLVGDNWGPSADTVLKTGMYGAVTFLLEYDYPVKTFTEMNSVVETPYNIIASSLTPTTIVCTITTLEKIKNIHPHKLYDSAVLQLGLPQPKRVKQCWGSHWNGEEWVHEQTSSVVSKFGPLPFFGTCSKVALCGMMSDRSTPYASMEAAVEVGTKMSQTLIGTKAPLKVIPLSILICMFLVFLLVWSQLR